MKQDSLKKKNASNTTQNQSYLNNLQNHITQSKQKDQENNIKNGIYDLDYIEDIKKRGWKSKQQQSQSDQNKSKAKTQISKDYPIGQIYYDNYAICSATLISSCHLISISKIQLKLRSKLLQLRIQEEQCFEIDTYEQKEIQNFYIIVFKLKQNIGDKLGYFGIITYTDSIFYEQFDIQNKKKTIFIPFYIDNEYISDITDESVIILKNQTLSQNKENNVEFLGLPLMEYDPSLGQLILGLVIKSSSQHFMSILLQQSHLQFLKQCITKDNNYLNTENVMKEGIYFDFC